MRLFQGTYKMEFNHGRFPGDSGLWRCTVTFNGLEVQAYAGSSRRAFKKAHRGMVKATKLRDAIRSVKGLCDDA